MRLVPVAAAALLVAGLLIRAAPAEDEGSTPRPAGAPPPKRTVLVELFTSQG